MNSIKPNQIFNLLVISFLVISAFAENDDGDIDKKLAEGEKRIGDQIRAILKHYQQKDPIGLPGAPIPDPMSVPGMKHSFSLYSMDFNEIQVRGLSKFRIDHIESDLALMQVTVELSIHTLNVSGIYTATSWFTGSSAGNFTVKLTGVEVKGTAHLQVNQDGKLEAQDIDMDLTFANIDLNFENLGLLGAVFQGIINSVGTFIFDSVKPYILKEVNTQVTGDVNKQISQLPQYFPNSISPFDMAVAEGRKQFSHMGYDPYKLEDHSQTIGIFTVATSHTWITGTSSFYRMGNITLEMKNGLVYAGVDIGTQEIEGTTQWELSVIGGALSRAGTVSFTVEYIRIKLTLSQPLDTRKRATLEELDLELGNIQARVHGAGTLDYIMEAGVNILPNLLRYQIMDAIEGPIKRRIQTELDKVDVEELIYEKIPQIEEQARQLQGLPPIEDTVFDEYDKKKINTNHDDDNDDLTPFSESEEDRGPS